MKLRVNKNQIQERTKVFFHSQTWKNFLVFLVFVFIAFTFWLSQYYQQRFDVQLEIPLNYENLPAEVVLTDSLPEKVTLQLQDKGTVILSYFFSRSARKGMTIDLSVLPKNQSTYTIDQTTISSLLRDKLQASTQLNTFSPTAIRVRYAPMEKKELPVVIQGTLLPAAGFVIVDSVEVTPTSVWVYGDKSSLAVVDSIRTFPVNLFNVNKSMQFQQDLDIPVGLRLSEKAVDITINIEEYTEKAFEVPIVCSNAPSHISVRFFPSTAEIVCQVPLSKYAQLEAEQLAIDLDYKKIASTTSTIIPLELTRAPAYLINSRISPASVEFLVEKKSNL